MDLLERIRSSIESKARVIGVRDVGELLKLHDKLVLENAELRNEIEMWKANADEAALKMARLQARVEELGQAQQISKIEEHEFICKIILDDAIVGAAGGNWPSRLQAELRNLRAQVAEAQTLGYPVNLFEQQANALKGSHR